MKYPLKLILIITFLTVMIIPQTACSKKVVEPVSNESFYFDTICSISIYDMEDMSKDRALKVINKAFKVCEHYDKLLGKNNVGGDIYNINHAQGKPVECDAETVDIVKRGIKYGDMTDGKFDITVGKAEDLWDFHGNKNVPPDKADLEAAMKYVDYRQIKVDGNTITMGTDKGEIDLGGIAKGYIADKLADFLEKEGVSEAIISLGGNIECIGNKGGEDFNIGIEKPYSDQSSIVGATGINNGTIVTSGVYERYFEYKGKKYHHILDSKTGMPIDSDVIGVSIKGKRSQSVDCDALATICLIYGSEKGKKIIDKKKDYEALFVLKNDKTISTKGFDFTKE